MGIMAFSLTFIATAATIVALGFTPMTAAPRHPPFVVVAGNIAAGKTGLVGRLAKALGAEPLLEDVNRNPFFRRFYECPEEWAFRSQVAFVSDSLRRHIGSLGLGPVVQDRTVYETVDVFSRTLHEAGWLSDDEMGALKGMRDAAAALPQQPSLMIYLHAPTEVIMRRIAERDRPAERGIAASYIDALAVAYDRFVASWDISPVLRVNTETTDVRTEPALAELITAIDPS
jgi:deoxyadenosine/deoxycytidine kinase